MEYVNGIELNANSETRELFLQAAQELIIEDQIDTDINKLSNPELAEWVQKKLQERVEKYFDESGLAKKSAECKNDDEITHLIAEEAQGVHGWVDMLPKFMKENSNSGMNCVMASTMLHIALERFGEENIHTLSVPGHHAVIKELPDGAIKYYDPSYYSKVDGKIVGYVRVFPKEQVLNREVIEERGGRSGFKFTLNRGERDSSGGFGIATDGEYIKKCYAYDSSIKSDLAIAIENLSGLREDAEKLGGTSDLPIIEEAPYTEAMVRFLIENNQEKITEEEILQIIQADVERGLAFLADVDKAARTDSPIPNIYDYLKSDRIKPKSETAPQPDPHEFMGEAKERHEQAKQICENYPFLKDFKEDEIVKTFGLFTTTNLVRN